MSQFLFLVVCQWLNVLTSSPNTLILQTDFTRLFLVSTPNQVVLSPGPASQPQDGTLAAWVRRADGDGRGGSLSGLLVVVDLTDKSLIELTACGQPSRRRVAHQFMLAGRGGTASDTITHKPKQHHMPPPHLFTCHMTPEIIRLPEQKETKYLKLFIKVHINNQQV